MRALLPVLLALALVVAAQPALAGGPEPGSVATITCDGSEGQRYAVYLPRAYTAEKRWPILYCFSPNAQGELFVQRYKQVCEEKGWIVVGSLNSRNGPWEPIQAAIDAMWKDTEARFSLSPTMRYATGFSGGARVSFALSEMQPKTIAGVIAIGAGMHEPGTMPREGLVVYLTCGLTDPNKRELDPLFASLEKAGRPVQYENFEGGHVMPPTALLEQAVRWMDGQAVERRLEAFQQAVALAREAQAEGDPVTAWLAVTKILDACPDVKGGVRREAEALRKVLERDQDVRQEVKAQEDLAKALKWIEKNRVRIEQYESPRKQAIEKLQRVIDRYPATRAATLAKDRLDAVGALQTD